MRLLMSLADYGRYRVLTVAGEIDLLTTGRFRETLFRAVEGKSTPVLVDMSNVAFCDSSCLNAVTAVHNRVAARGQQLALFAPSRHVQKVFRITRLDQVIRIYPSLDAAIAGTCPASG
ncbi:STAS domain-containing protein [Actinomadura gamaensis]|uniref:Anti-sigma factor antagonist n=1 Tax=Actinomadura gamaensis TaxID=1763541 RepID=A0ABV9UBC7_9ACTN